MFWWCSFPASPGRAADAGHAGRAAGGAAVLRPTAGYAAGAAIGEDGFVRP